MHAPVHDILVFIAYASTEGSDETAHSHSLARALAARTIYMKAQAKLYGPVHESVVFIVL